jgi:hypothetical protein
MEAAAMPRERANALKIFFMIEEVRNGNAREQEAGP